MAANTAMYFRHHSQRSAAVSDKGEGMPRAVENTQADLTSCPEVLSQRCLILPSWPSKLLLCRESPAVSITKACNTKARMLSSAKNLQMHAHPAMC